MDVELIGKTVKGKNKIRERGKFAKVLYDSSHVFFSDKVGRWLFITPHNRWIFEDNDPDFIVKHV